MLSLFELSPAERKKVLKIVDNKPAGQIFICKEPFSKKTIQEFELKEIYENKKEE